MFFFRFFSTIGYCKIFNTVPCAIELILAAICFICSSRQCQSQSPNLSLLPFSPLVTTSLSSTFVSLFLL